MPVPVRLAHHDELAAIQAIEVAAGALFTTVGMDAIAEDDPPPCTCSPATSATDGHGSPSTATTSPSAT